ncbi:MAG: hypothetical protein ACRDJT_06390 [Actinomycetota bacterium]
MTTSAANPDSSVTADDQMRRNQRQLAFHGTVVLLIGLLAGIGFSYAAATEPVTSDLYKNWRFAHLEGMVNGIVVLAAAGVWAYIDTGRRAVDIGRWLLLIGAYANAIGPWITALFIGHRVIEPSGLLENVVVWGFYVPGVLPLASFLLFVGSQVADRRRTST